MALSDSVFRTRLLPYMLPANRALHSIIEVSFVALSVCILIAAFPVSTFDFILTGSNFVLTVPGNTSVRQSLVFQLIVTLPENISV